MFYVKTLEFHSLHSDMWHRTFYTAMYTNKLLEDWYK